LGYCTYCLWCPKNRWNLLLPALRAYVINKTNRFLLKKIIATMVGAIHLSPAPWEVVAILSNPFICNQSLLLQEKTRSPYGTTIACVVDLLIAGIRRSFSLDIRQSDFLTFKSKK
jgi:hypothetical protein